MKLNVTLLIILIASIIIVICVNLVWLNTYELFPLGSEIGYIFSNLGLAYIGSYIFYLLLVITKEKKDKKKIYSLINTWSEHLTGRAYSVYLHLNIQVNNGVNGFDKQTVTQQQFFNLCQQVNPSQLDQRTLLNFSGQQATHGYWVYQNSIVLVDELKEKIFTYMPFLDSEHVRLINRLYETKFHITAPALLFATNTDFTMWQSDMFEYLLRIRELEDYIQNVSKPMYS